MLSSRLLRLRSLKFLPSLPKQCRVAHLCTTPRIEDDRQRSPPQSTGRFPMSNSIVDRASQVYQNWSSFSTRVASIYNRAAASSYGRLMRLDKPTGSQLLFMPCAWGIAAGATSVFDVLGYTAVFYGGSILMRGAGCTVNDIWDADVDKNVARTAERPIAAGEISVTSATAFAVAQMLGGLGLLTTLSPTSFVLGIATVIPVLYYPLAKRVLKSPQTALALTFNSGALLGYAAATNVISATAIFLYGSGVCWTMVYDTIYGHQDKSYDSKLGLNSTALLYGTNTKSVLAAFGCGQFALLFAAGALADLSTPFYMGSAIAASRVFSQIYSTDLDKPEDCAKAFNDSPGIGAIIWGSILAGRLF